MRFLLAGGMAHTSDFQSDAQSHARERMVAIQHHMLGVDIGDGVDHFLGHLAAASRGQGMAFDGHAFFQAFRKQTARL